MAIEHSLATRGNIFDVQKMKAPDGSPVDFVLNTLVETDDFTKDLPVFPANGGLTHYGLRTVNLPTGYFVDIGGSWKTSKSQLEPFIEGLATVRSTYQAPKDTYNTMEKSAGKARLAAERTGHITMMNQTWGDVMLQGVSVPNQSAIIGLMKRPPYMTYDSAFCFSAGGTSDLRSCWLMKPGIATVHGLYNPNHPTLGIEEDDKGEQLIDALGSGTDEHRWDIMIEYMIQKGLCIVDQRAVKRICNVPCGVSANPGVDLINAIIDASIINVPKMTMNPYANLPQPWFLYCDERLFSKLIRASNDKLFVYMSAENIYRTRMPMIGPDIIVRRWDALNKVLGAGETEIVAA